MWVVTGASGFVGGAVVAELRAGGHDVVALSRRASTSRGIRAVSYDNPGELRRALSGAQNVIHCAAVVHKPHTPRSEHEFTVTSAKALLAAARDVGVRSFVLCSTIKVHGEHPPAELDESTPLRPDGPYAAAKARAEEVVLEAHGLRTSVARLCPVYGIGDKGNVRTMIRAIRRRVFFVPGDGATRKSIVHISTVADALVALATSKTASGTFLVADREAPTLRQLANTIAAALHIRPPPSLPLSLLTFAGTVLGAMAQKLGRSTSLSAAQVFKATTPTVCNPARLQRETGVDCHVDLDAAIREEVRWLRATGNL
jgi:nucleoside-diphosphate-sugar epimerase